MQSDIQRIGQISVFIIVGIVCILILGVSFVFSFKETTPISGTHPRFPELKSITRHCLAETGSAAVLYISAQGGFFMLPSDNAPQLPYYLIGGKQSVPSLGVFEQSMIEYLQSELSFCINRNTPSEVSPKIISTQVIGQHDDVVFIAKINFQTPTQPVQDVLVEETVTIKSRLSLLQSVAKEVVAIQAGQKAICLSCLANLGESKNLSIIIGRQDNEDLLVQIIDRTSNKQKGALIDPAIESPFVLAFLMQPYNISSPQNTAVFR